MAATVSTKMTRRANQPDGATSEWGDGKHIRGDEKCPARIARKHPGWGPQTLRLEIAKDERFAGLKILSRARIAAYLKEQKKVRKYERHNDLAEPQEQLVQRPHQEWEMDAQGVTTVAGLGKVSFINFLDVYSHVSIDSHVYLNVSHPSHKNISRSYGGPLCAMGCQNRSAWIMKIKMVNR